MAMSVTVPNSKRPRATVVAPETLPVVAGAAQPMTPPSPELMALEFGRSAVPKCSWAFAESLTLTHSEEFAANLAVPKHSVLRTRAF